MSAFTIKVPASSANIGPGFDVLGIGLNLYLEIIVEINVKMDTSADAYNAKLKYEGEGVESVPLESNRNLVTQTALYVMRCNGMSEFPVGTQIFVRNPIPLGRGLGSSGAAIVGGVLLGNEIANLNLSKKRLLDYCLLIERHPDNIAAAMLGGFVGSFLNELSPANQLAASVPLEHILPKCTTMKHDYEKRPPPFNIAQYLKYNWNKSIRCVTVIPQFEVKTDEARAVLPNSYSKRDLVFNLQRLAILTTALTLDPPEPTVIYEAMKDKIHQPYRANLIPGLTSVLDNVLPDTTPGLCGVCLSGAGPTVLCLATENFEGIARTIIDIFHMNNVKCSWKLLDLAFDGATLQKY